MRRSISLSPSKRGIFQYIAQRNDVAKEEIQQALQLASSTASRLLQDMVEEGLLLSSGYGPSKGGRRPILYNVNHDYGYIVGLEISRFYATLGLFDLALNAKSLTRWRMDSSMKPEVFIELVAQKISAYCKDHRLSLEQIVGIGIGSIGPLDRTGGVLINPAHFPAEGWANLPISELVAQRMNMPVLVDNGADCAAIGEQLMFRKQGLEAEHLLYINAGVGLRTAMISGGSLVQGSYDREGAFGEMIIRAGDPPILPGKPAGALENYASIPALVEQYKTQYRLGRTGISSTAPAPAQEAQIDFDFLIRELRHENPVVRELFHQSAMYLGIGVANLINTFQPHQVIIGGALISAYKGYSEIVASIAHKYTYNSPLYQAQFMEGLLLEDAVATGAALLVRNKLF